MFFTLETTGRLCRQELLLIWEVRQAHAVWPLSQQKKMPHRQGP